MLNVDETKNLVGVLMTVAGGIVVSTSKGKISEADWAALTGAALMFIGPLFNIVTHWNMVKVPETQVQVAK